MRNIITNGYYEKQARRSITRDSETAAVDQLIDFPLLLAKSTDTAAVVRDQVLQVSK